MQPVAANALPVAAEALERWAVDCLLAVDMPEAAARERQAVRVIERLGESNRLLPAIHPFIEIAAFGQWLGLRM
mgnify:CR=1 FL=1